MRTKAGPKPDPKSAETSAPLPAPSPVSVEEKVNRISIPLNKDGQIEWDSMRGSTQAKVRALMGEGSGKPDPSSAPVEVFDAAWTGTMFDMVGKIEAFAAMKLYKFSPEVAEKAFTYTPAEKEKLAVPTARVINKYAPVWLEKFKDEIALAGLFVTITAMKFQMASMLMKVELARNVTGKTENAGNGNRSVSDPDIVVSPTEIKEQTN
jgi:hypothetical protein